MDHGFGQSINELKAIELCMVAHAKGYGTQSNSNVIKLTNHFDMELTIEVINNKYLVKRNDKHIGYKSIEATVKGIDTAFNMLLNESNKQYD